MLHPTKALVLKYTKYGDSSLIVNMYTEVFGLQSYLIKGIRTVKSHGKAGVFRPGNILDLIVYHREGRKLNHIREFRYEILYESIPFNILKSSLSLFMVEIIYNAIREEEPNPDLFRFIVSNFETLDKTNRKLAQFHFQFLLELTKYLGLYPRGKFSPSYPYFDMREGTFVSTPPQNEEFMDKDLSIVLSELLHQTEQISATLIADRVKRKALLKKLINYYRIHLVNFKKMQSPEILEEVLKAY